MAAVFDLIPTLVPLTPAEVRTLYAEHQHDRAVRICHRCGVDPDRYAAWLVRAMSAFTMASPGDHVPAIAEALVEMLPPTAEGFERAIVLGIAMGLVTGLEKA